MFTATVILVRTSGRRHCRQLSSLANYENELRMTTCSKVYSQNGDNKLFKKCPKKGIELDVKYVDTNAGQRSKTPTVLALHGCPGTFGDFSSLINHLTARGVRVVAPNFPNMAYTDKTGHFRHTTEEKAEYITDFVKNMGIESFDSVIMHSSACYSGLKFVTDKVVPVRSVALFNPAGHRRVKAMKPEWFISNLVKMNLTPTGRKLFTKFGPPVLDIMKVSVKTAGDQLDNAVWSAITMELAEVTRLSGYLNYIRMRGMPTLLAYSVNDRLIDEKVSEEMADMLGARPDHVAHFNKEGQVTSGQPLTQGQTGRLKVLKFDNGGHYAFLRQPTESNQAVASLIDYATMQTSSQLHREEEFVEKYETWANIRFV